MSIKLSTTFDVLLLLLLVACSFLRAFCCSSISFSMAKKACQRGQLPMSLVSPSNSVSCSLLFRVSCKLLTRSCLQWTCHEQHQQQLGWIALHLLLSGPPCAHQHGRSSSSCRPSCRSSYQTGLLHLRDRFLKVGLRYNDSANKGQHSHWKEPSFSKHRRQAS